MPLWLMELFCPEHGLPILMEAFGRYWSLWRFGMRFHLSARAFARKQWLLKLYRRFRHEVPQV